MFISDKKTLDYLTAAMILYLPWIGTAWSMWGWIWEIIILLALLRVGLRKGLKWASILLIAGYGLAVLSFRLPGLEKMGFVPWAGLVCIIGWKKDWPQRVTVFWSIVAAGLLGAIPTLGFQGFGIQTQEFINSMMTQYKSIILHTAMQEQGITEIEVRTMFEQGFNIYEMIIPSLAAISSVIEFGLIYYFFVRWIVHSGKGRVPFSYWCLPWYAVWGAIVAFICYLLGDQFSWVLLRSFGLNLMVVYAAVALVIGTSVYFFFLQSPHIPRFLKWVLVLGNIFYFLFSLISVILFGLFDLVFNFRRLPEVRGGED
ncbi:MAG: DUF2232 domain-containing protein [Desulfitobacteriaceae bacterium]